MVQAEAACGLKRMVKMTLVAVHEALPALGNDAIYGLFPS